MTRKRKNTLEGARAKQTQAAESSDPEPLPSLPPRRRNFPLLIVSLLLFGLWVSYLVFVALNS